VVDEGQLYKSIRLIRKDELIVVPTTKISRSPQIYQRKLNEIKLPKRISRILSAVIDNNCMLKVKVTFKNLNFRFSYTGRKDNWRRFLNYYEQ
jgi:hypothetical protein